MHIKIFFTYYLISGLLTMAYVHKNYEKIIDAIPFANIFSKEVIFLIQFLTGFMQFPFIIILKIHGIILSIRLSRATKRNKKLAEQTEIIKYVNSQLIELFEKLPQKFVEEGYVPYIVYVFTDKQKTIQILVNCSCKEEEEMAMRQIKEICIAQKAVAVFSISEALEKRGDKDVDVLLLEIESSWYSTILTIDIDRDKKTVGERYRSDMEPFFLPHLKKIK